MTDDILNRLNLFTDDQVTVNRIALNMDQVRKYNPPPNPAKITDSRAKSYIAEYGEESWELDALKPDVIAALIRSHVDKLRDDELYDHKIEQENFEKLELDKLSKQWERVRKHIK